MKALCLAASAASRQPLRRRISVIVECRRQALLAHVAQPATQFARPPGRMLAAKRDDLGLHSRRRPLRTLSGRRERSEREAPFSSPRPSHLYPVFRLIPNRRQRSETFEPSCKARQTNSRRSSTIDLKRHMTRLQSRHHCGKCVTHVPEHLLPISPVHTPTRGEGVAADPTKFSDSRD